MKKIHLGGISGDLFKTRIRANEVTGAERWLGYCLGPALVTTLNAGVAGSYLNSFYTDVLGLNAVLGGLFLTLMPVLSK
ncbi:MAG: MFS transporter, partial [Lachnospiraceae bacterium]|nr:MFS transporter [Lachnospiraceae bacterium]